MMESIMCNDDIVPNMSQALKFPLAPKRTKQTKSDDALSFSQVTSSQLKSKKNRSIDTCKTCEKMDPLNSKGHRKGSNCPYHEDFCQICVKMKKFTNLHSTDLCPHSKKRKKKETKQNKAVHKKRKHILSVDTSLTI